MKMASALPRMAATENGSEYATPACRYASQAKRETSNDADNSALTYPNTRKGLKFRFRIMV
jgi:hypothetical protein